ncbi:hypothetical protein EUTSA_v10021080mg [Eutrema salsugineum]|uniref:DUF1995 domain-containing protein n=1 Tax=Eutrema salsugineum TaxID=72664 RepID=V4LZ59_EUTSA|nr:uncharacterized protein LOC18024589 [Eutrema salsugineum]ESQ47812.1 hypothetical protein EUTSA_v10021080mg [Eutrema salsugineum]
MASSTLFKLNSQTFKALNPSSSSPYHPQSIISDLHFPKSLSRHSRLSHKSTTTTRFLVPLCFSLPSPSSPPISKEEAISQAKNCLSSCLIKPLNNPKLASPKLKRLKQPRFRLEIPILDDDSPSSLSQLASSIFSDIPISRKGSNVKLLFLWPDPSFIEAAVKAFRSDNTNHIAVSPVSESVKGALRSADVAVFMAPERSQLEDVRKATEGFSTKPVVMMNPRWLYEEEKSFGDEFNGFIGSFEVIYAFTGLEVRGVLSKRKGVIFKCVRDGVVSGERWNVLVEEEEGNGTLKVVSQFKARPSIDEVELVLYNLMAMNSPITKSAKFLKDLVSNITGKK